MEYQSKVSGISLLDVCSRQSIACIIMAVFISLPESISCCRAEVQVSREKLEFRRHLSICSRNQPIFVLQPS